MSDGFAASSVLFRANRAACCKDFPPDLSTPWRVSFMFWFLADCFRSTLAVPLHSWPLFAWANRNKSLGSNGIGDEGGLALAEGLARNSSLGHLT